ncbi:hypothetical protein [Streptomyces sp. NPDC029003]|uniref:hypothetical protein n=1 Tax=Streptomyces sp. NPDC029003 TaxID=3155125 RepID=UPI0033C60E94
MLLDVTGDGKKELLIAADTGTGRTVLSVYTAEGTRIVPVLFTIGRETIAFGQAQVIGAVVTLSNPVPSGAAASVALPRA